MRTNTLLVTIALLGLSCVGTDASDERSHVERFRELHTIVEKGLPAGWVVETALADPTIPARRGSYPTLVVRSAEPLPVEYTFPGMPGRSADEPDPPPKITPVVVTVHFVASPRMSPDAYATACAHNDALRQKRRDFERQHLKECPSAHKGPAPIPPYAYSPRTEREIDLVRQYAFLWISTEPQPLPTHFTHDLSFTMHQPGFFHIHDAGKSKEYDQILVFLEEIITPYPTER